VIAVTAEPQPYRIYKLLIEDETWRSVSESVIPFKALSLPRNFASRAEFLDFWKDLEAKSARSYALKRIARKSFTSHELEKDLLQKLISVETVHRIVGDFKNSGLIDDQGWLEAFILKEQRRGISPRLLAEKLKFKGLPADLIRDALQKFYPETLEVISALIKKKQKTKDRPKLIAYLARKGFSLPNIYTALDR